MPTRPANSVSRSTGSAQVARERHLPLTAIPCLASGTSSIRYGHHRRNLVGDLIQSRREPVDLRDRCRHFRPIPRHEIFSVPSHGRQMRSSALSQLEAIRDRDFGSRGKVMLQPPYPGCFLSHEEKQRVQIKFDRVNGRQPQGARDSGSPRRPSCSSRWAAFLYSSANRSICSGVADSPGYVFGVSDNQFAFPIPAQF